MLEYHHDHITNKKNIENAYSVRATSLPFFLHSAGHWHVGSKYFVRREGREDYYLLYTISGNGFMKYMGKNHKLSKGSAILIDCKEFHHYGALENWEHVWFHLNGYAMKNMYININSAGVAPIAVNDDKFILDFFELFERNSNKYELNNELEIAHGIMDLLAYLIEKKKNDKASAHNPPPEWYSKINDYIYTRRYKDITVFELSEKFGIPICVLEQQYKTYAGVDITDTIRIHRTDYLKTKDIVCYNPDWLMDSINYIENNFASKISIEELIGRAYVSRSLFISKFKQYTSMSPKQYILKVRIANARKRLEKTNDPISDIAYECGFASASDFSKKFKDFFGVTPNDFRNGK